MNDEKKISKKIQSIRLIHRGLLLSYCAKPAEIIAALTPEVMKKSFPPDGEPALTELDHFFSITRNDEFIGFFRVINLYFYEELQLHGSYNKETNFSIRAYFELGHLFVQTIMQLFPEKTISSTTLRSNIPAQRFLGYLGFIRVGILKDNDNYYYYKRPTTSTTNQ